MREQVEEAELGARQDKGLGQVRQKHCVQKTLRGTVARNPEACWPGKAAAILLGKCAAILVDFPHRNACQNVTGNAAP